MPQFIESRIFNVIFSSQLCNHPGRLPLPGTKVSEKTFRTKFDFLIPPPFFSMKRLYFQKGPIFWPITIRNREYTMQAVKEMEINSEQYNGMLPHTSLEKTIKIIQKQLLPLKSSDCFLLRVEQKVDIQVGKGKGILYRRV